MLTISSEKEQEKEEKKITRIIIAKSSVTNHSQIFNLPDYTDENQIDANYKDGILHVAIAKKEGGKKKTAKTIAIK
jgi:HSP20 family protein